MIVSLHVQVEPLGAALAENVPDSFYTLTTLTTVRVLYYLIIYVILVTLL